MIREMAKVCPICHAYMQPIKKNTVTKSRMPFWKFRKTTYKIEKEWECRLCGGYKEKTINIIEVKEGI